MSKHFRFKRHAKFGQDTDARFVLGIHRSYDRFNSKIIKRSIDGRGSGLSRIPQIPKFALQGKRNLHFWCMWQRSHATIAYAPGFPGRNDS